MHDKRCYVKLSRTGRMIMRSRQSLKLTLHTFTLPVERLERCSEIITARMQVDLGCRDRLVPEQRLRQKQVPALPEKVVGGRMPHLVHLDR